MQDYFLSDVRAIVRELLSYNDTHNTFIESDASVDKEYEFDADRALEILEHFSRIDDVELLFKA